MSAASRRFPAAAAIAGLALVHGARLAELFGKSPDWWARNRDRLEAKGFPRPVPGVPGMYDPVAVRAWLDRQMPEHLRPAAAEPAPAAPEDRAAIERVRADALARLPRILRELGGDPAGDPACEQEESENA